MFILRSLFVFGMLFFLGCESDDEAIDGVTDGNPSQTDFSDLLQNQIDHIIIPAMDGYQAEMSALKLNTDRFVNQPDSQKLATIQQRFQSAYLSYQAAAVHNYFATQNQALVSTTNLFPVDTASLEDAIRNQNYNFSTSAQQRANGFPALDYLLYGSANVLGDFAGDSLRLNFLDQLVNFMHDKSIALSNAWIGSLRDNYVSNGGTQLGSSISVQLNESLIYYEVHIRENKVGIPIGRLGPNDSPITPDPTKIEGYYLSRSLGNEAFTLSLLRKSIEEMERIYSGEGSSAADNQGYDDLLLARGQGAVDNDIQAQFDEIYQEIDNRTQISGDDELYLRVQRLITLYKSDLFPLLNVQDADGANDGD